MLTLSLNHIPVFLYIANVTLLRSLFTHDYFDHLVKTICEFYYDA